jgi:hypothetical protein
MADDSLAMDYNDAFIADYEARVYPDGGMTGGQRALLRKQLEEEHLYYLKEAARVDNNTGHDDQ